MPQQTTYPVAIQRRFKNKSVSLIAEIDIILQMTPGTFKKSKGSVLRTVSINTVNNMRRPFRVFAWITNKGTKVEFIPVTK